MTKGKIKWYNARKGYGFISPDDGGKDVFVHASAVAESGLETLNEGDSISFEVADDKGKTKAVNLKKSES